MVSVGISRIGQVSVVATVVASYLPRSHTTILLQLPRADDNVIYGFLDFCQCVGYKWKVPANCVVIIATASKVGWPDDLISPMYTALGELTSIHWT